MNPAKAREIFNNYQQLNDKIDVSVFLIGIEDGHHLFRHLNCNCNWFSPSLFRDFVQNTGQFIKKIVQEHEQDFLAAFE